MLFHTLSQWLFIYKYIAFYFFWKCIFFLISLFALSLHLPYWHLCFWLLLGPSSASLEESEDAKPHPSSPCTCHIKKANSGSSSLIFLISIQDVVPIICFSLFLLEKKKVHILFIKIFEFPELTKLGNPQVFIPFKVYHPVPGAQGNFSLCCPSLISLVN